MVMAPSINESHIMANETLSLPKKNTPTTSGQATPETSTTSPDLKSPDATKGAVPEVKADISGKTEIESIKTVSTAIKSTTATDNASVENKSEKTAGEKAGETTKDVPVERTKMEIATEIYLSMKKTKGITRKEILERFVSEAKLSKAGSSTYFQLIKAKHP
jgi:hypothetical protein